MYVLENWRKEVEHFLKIKQRDDLSNNVWPFLIFVYFSNTEYFLIFFQRDIEPIKMQRSSLKK